MAITSSRSNFSCVGRGKSSDEQDGTLVDEFVCDGTASGWTAHMWCSAYQRFGLLRNPAFRTGMSFWVLFIMCFGVAGFVFYETLQQRILERIDQSIMQRADSIRAIHERLGTEGIMDIALANNQVPMQSSMGFHLSTPDGARIAGNVPICITEMGWNVLRGSDLGVRDDEGYYRFLTMKLGDNVLSLGKSLSSLDEMRSIALNCLMWALLGSTFLAILAASWVANRMRRRVKGLALAMDRVASGNLDARLPVGTPHDDVDEMASQMNSALDRLGETVDGMRQVSSDIAHDLKTPLNRLFIHLEEAARKSDNGVNVQNELDEALGEVQQINGTFEALLRIAQIEAGARRSQFVEFDLAEVMATAAEVYEPVVEECCEGLYVDFKSDPLPMMGDRALVLQMIVNLIENAIHHRENDTTHIRLNAGERDGQIWFSVTDNGVGIPDAECEKVFRRLYRLQRSRTTSGTGLGLSLVKAIGDLHCGRVTLGDNKPGLIVTATFDLNCPVPM